MKVPYPHNPDGPVGPEYPKGFELWYGCIIIAVIIFGMVFFR